jgi:hypothetical protein
VYIASWGTPRAPAIVQDAEGDTGFKPASCEPFCPVKVTMPPSEKAFVLQIELVLSNLLIFELAVAHAS